MGFFLDIIRDSRRTVVGQPDAGSVQWDEVVEGYLGPEQGSVADLRDVEPRPKRAPNGPFSPGPPSVESRDAGWDEERFVFSRPENPADDALAELRDPAVIRLFSESLWHRHWSTRKGRIPWEAA